MVADGGPHGSRAVCLAAEEPAVSTGGCDRRASYQQVRACGRVGGGLVPQPQGQVVAVTEVADRGDPGHQAGTGGQPHPFQDRVVGIGDVTYRVVAGIEGQVDVRVDETGQQGRLAKVHHVNARRHRRPGLHRDDAAVVDQHDRSFDQSGTDTIEQAGGTDREHESSPTAGATGARRAP